MQEICEITAIIANISTVVGVLIIVFAFYTFTVERKQLNLNTITRCIDIYRNGFLDLNINNRLKIKSYLDFVNEELFYFENNYLPKAIADEWIDGIIDFVPLYNSKSELMNEEKDDYANVIHKLELLDGYPRIKNAFTFKKDFEMSEIFNEKKHIRDKSRKKMIKKVLKNLGYRWWKKFV